MKNSFAGIAAVVVAMLINSCKCEVQKVVYPTGDDMYAYVFRDTSVWVYKNTTTNVLDTMMMYRMGHGGFGIDTTDKCVKLRKEIFVMDFKSSLKPYPPVTYFIDYTGIRLNGTGVPPNYGTEVYNRLSSIDDSNGYTKYDTLYTQLSIQGAVYDSVKKMRLLFHPNSGFPDEAYLYWAPYVGLVRKEFHDSIGGIEYWDLIESNLKNY